MRKKKRVPGEREREREREREMKKNTTSKVERKTGNSKGHGQNRKGEGPPYRRPRGRAPYGMVWDEIGGEWVPAAGDMVQGKGSEKGKDSGKREYEGEDISEIKLAVPTSSSLEKGKGETKAQMHANALSREPATSASASLALGVLEARVDWVFAIFRKSRGLKTALKSANSRLRKAKATASEGEDVTSQITALTAERNHAMKAVREPCRSLLRSLVSTASVLGASVVVDYATEALKGRAQGKGKARKKTETKRKVTTKAKASKNEDDDEDGINHCEDGDGRGVIDILEDDDDESTDDSNNYVDESGKPFECEFGCGFDAATPDEVNLHQLTCQRLEELEFEVGAHQTEDSVTLKAESGKFSVVKVGSVTRGGLMRAAGIRGGDIIVSVGPPQRCDCFRKPLHEVRSALARSAQAALRGERGGKFMLRVKRIGRKHAREEKEGDGNSGGAQSSLGSGKISDDDGERGDDNSVDGSTRARPSFHPPSSKRRKTSSSGGSKKAGGVLAKLKAKMLRRRR